MRREINVDRREHSFSVLGRVDEMRRDKQYCDFLIKVGSEEIHAHRNILAGGSDYFHAMFSHDTKENKSGVVEMLDVDPKCAIICIDHIYGGKAFVPDGKDEEMMHVADLMQLHTLRDAIASLLAEELDPKSYFAATKIANMYACKELEEKCIEFASENFLEISKEKGFAEMEKSYIEKVIGFLNINVSEEEKLDIWLKWIKRDLERKAHLVEAVKSIKLTDVSPGYLRHLIESEPLVKRNSECMVLLSLSILDDFKVTPHPAHPNAPYRTTIALFDHTSCKVHRFDPQDESCTVIHEMQKDTRVSFSSAVLLDDHIYVLTRRLLLYRLKYLESPATWERMADAITGHESYPHVTVSAGSIYVMTEKSIEAYDPTKNQWSEFAKKSKPSKWTQILGSRGYIYSFGGYYDGLWRNDFCRFDIASIRCENLAPMKQARGDGTAVEFKGKIYVFGGSDGNNLRTTECYDISRNTWTALTPMLNPRRKLKNYVIRKEIYIVGRDEGGRIEKYNVDKDEWKVVLDTNLRIWESVAI